MKYIFFIFPLLFLFSVSAKDEGELFDKEYLFCLDKIENNKELNHEIKNFSSSLVFEFSGYCKCSVKEREKELNHKKENLMSWLFSGKDARLQSEDYCAIKTLSQPNREKIFFYVFGLEIKNYLNEKLVEYYSPSIRVIASPESYEAKLLCLSDAIYGECSVVSSYFLTYQCITKSLNFESIGEKEKYCPEFKRLDVSVN